MTENIPSSDLVPGDIIELPKHQATVVCDAVLLTGQCILNESMLTGMISHKLIVTNCKCFTKFFEHLPKTFLFTYYLYYIKLVLNTHLFQILPIQS